MKKTTTQVLDLNLWLHSFRANANAAAPGNRHERQVAGMREIEMNVFPGPRQSQLSMRTPTLAIQATSPVDQTMESFAANLKSPTPASPS